MSETNSNNICFFRGEPSLNRTILKKSRQQLGSAISFPSLSDGLINEFIRDINNLGKWEINGNSIQEKYRKKNLDITHLGENFFCIEGHLYYLNMKIHGFDGKSIKKCLPGGYFCDSENCYYRGNIVRGLKVEEIEQFSYFIEASGHLITTTGIYKKGEKVRNINLKYIGTNNFIKLKRHAITNNISTEFRNEGKIYIGDFIIAGDTIVSSSPNTQVGENTNTNGKFDKYYQKWIEKCRGFIKTFRANLVA